jgi:teichuronic acid biosynthesis protein TuaE
LLLLGIYYFRKTDNLLRITAITVILLGSIIFVKVFPTEFKAAKIIFNSSLRTTLKEGNSYLMTSGKIRTRLNIESINMAIESKLFGVGGGNYEDYMSRSRYHKTAWVIFAHNWWLELLANFGFVIFLCMVVIYLRWLLTLWRLRQSAQKEDSAIYDAYFISLLLFLPLSLVPSTIRAFYSVWVYFGIINAICLTHSVKRESKTDLVTSPSDKFALSN